MECVQVQENSLPFTYSKLEENDRPKITSRDISIANGCDNGECAVFIRNVYKRYEYGPLVLRNICMKVRKGTIYGLLGSSGCGKTTILSCIVGLQKCDSGEILVFGREPGTTGSGIPGKRLGYMPQEIALYYNLTIREIVQFYGRVYSMSGSQIMDQWDFLNMLLKLPSDCTIIGELSGGQQRRVSLALALIHSPELLILDEPTVGLDPLLRQEYGNNLTTFGIICTQLLKSWERLSSSPRTTHYIEEARNSNTIGVMRNGRLLVEDTPSNLLRNYNCELLEQVVLQLCKKDANNLTIVSTAQIENRQAIGYADAISDQVVARKAADQNMFGKHNSENTIGQGITQFLQRIYGFTTVLMMTYLRNPFFVVGTLFLPSIQGSLTLLCVGSKPGGIHLGIVNPEVSNWATECDSAHLLNETCDLSALSCNFLNHLIRDDMVVLSFYENEDEAIAQTHLGRVSGFITFPENYSRHTFDLLALKLFAVNETISGSRIHVHLDYSHKILVLLSIKHLFSSYLLYVKDVMDSCQLGSQQTEMPLLFRTPVFGKEDDYTTYIIPGLIIISIGAVGFALTGIMVISDRKQGTLSRAHVAGLTITDVLTSHLIMEGIVAVSQIAVWNVVLYFGFGFVSVGSPWIMIAFCMITHLTGCAVGLFVGQILHEAVHVLCAAVLLFTIFIQFASTIFPKELMSTFWRHFAYSVPTTLPTQALRAVTTRGIGWTDPLVWSGLLVLLAWMTAMLFFSVLMYKKFNK